MISFSDNLRVASFNCKNVKTSITEICKLCNTCDIVFLQETWLSPQEYHFLESIDNDFYVTCSSPMDVESEVLRGRPRGGCAILYRKSLAGCKSYVIPECDSRAIALKVPIKGDTVLFINTYMPYERHDNIDDFIFYLSQIHSYIDNSGSSYSCIVGDFNANIRDNDNSKFTHEIFDFCSSEGFTLADKLLCDADTFTFYSEAHHTVHWLDHYIISDNFVHVCNDIHVDYTFATSDHFPIFAVFDVDCIHTTYQSGTCNVNRVPWDSLSDDELHRYQDITLDNLKSVVIDHDLLLCDDANCHNPHHISGIDRLYCDIIDSLTSSSEQFIKIKSRGARFKQVPGWNEYCAASHSAARESFLHWASSGKPRYGVVFDNMKRTRAYFKYTLRMCKTNGQKSQADSLAKKLLSKDSKQFWKEIKKLKGENTNSLAFTIENISGEKNICDLWKDHYESILNSSKSTTLKTKIIDELSDCTTPDNPFSFHEIKSAIKGLKNGKACGRDGLQSEHFKYGPDRLCGLLCMLFNSMILHGYMPVDLLDTFLTPIVKDKRGDLGSKDNYRPIAVTSVLSKILETIVLNRYQYCLVTCCNQFGFKVGHSTDMCVFTLKHIIDYYQDKSSPVFICYLDASKAFDRLNFWVLFDKLLTRGMPKIIVRLLVFWYTHQNFYVRWGSSLSNAFKSSNGTRQGGVLSPYLFNVYVDDLSVRLNSLNVGCYISNTCVNHLMYADDSVLIAPSISILQHMILECQEYAETCDILFNVKKTVYMCVKSRNIYMPKVPSLFLNDQLVDLVDSHKYLGVTMTSDRQDHMDISRSIRTLYIRGNSLISNFKHCSDDVKVQLFKSYCTSIYCCHLWSNFSQDVYRRIRSAFNRIFRLLMNLYHRISISATFLQYGVNHFDILIRNNVTSFIKRLEVSDNTILRNIVASTFYTNSAIYCHWKNIIY